MSQFSIYCNVCEDDRDLLYAPESGSYTCVECGTIYYDEDGVFDATDWEGHRAYYRGSKLAGLVPDPDWPDDEITSRY